MNRTNKIAIFLAAILIPGGFVALFSAWLMKRASETERGRKAIDLARSHAAVLRSRVPAWLAQPRFSQEELSMPKAA